MRFRLLGFDVWQLAPCPSQVNGHIVGEFICTLTWWLRDIWAISEVVEAAMFLCRNQSTRALGYKPGWSASGSGSSSPPSRSASQRVLSPRKDYKISKSKWKHLCYYLKLVLKPTKQIKLCSSIWDLLSRSSFALRDFNRPPPRSNLLLFQGPGAKALHNAISSFFKWCLPYKNSFFVVPLILLFVQSYSKRNIINRTMANLLDPGLAPESQLVEAILLTCSQVPQGAHDLRALRD